MNTYNMGNCNSYFSKKKFINETLHNIHRNSHIFYDQENKVISEEEIIYTLDGMYRRQSINYYKNSRCKPKMVELFVPNWWRF